MKSTQSPQDKPLMRFLTLGCAHVHVISARVWKCQGCGQRGEFLASLETARREANDHAGLCRATPQDETEQDEKDDRLKRMARRIGGLAYELDDELRDTLGWDAAHAIRDRLLAIADDVDA